MADRIYPPTIPDLLKVIGYTPDTYNLPEDVIQKHYLYAIQQIDFLTNGRASLEYKNLSDFQFKYLVIALARLFNYYVSSNQNFIRGQVSFTQGANSGSFNFEYPQTIDPNVYTALKMSGLYNPQSNKNIGANVRGDYRGLNPYNNLINDIFSLNPISGYDAYHTFLYGHNLISSDGTIEIKKTIDYTKGGIWDIAVNKNITKDVQANKADIAINKNDIQAVVTETGILSLDVNQNKTDISENKGALALKLSANDVKAGTGITVTPSPTDRDVTIAVTQQPVHELVIQVPAFGLGDNQVEKVLTTSEIAWFNNNLGKIAINYTFFRTNHYAYSFPTFVNNIGLDNALQYAKSQDANLLQFSIKLINNSLSLATNTINMMVVYTESDQSWKLVIGTENDLTTDTLPNTIFFSTVA